MISILYEDNDIFIVDKPAGISVQPGEKAGRTILELIEEQTHVCVKPVHRLDRDTSGVLILAKNREAASSYSKIIESGAVTKKYVALCLEILTPQSGTISEDIIQHGITKKANTKYTTIKNFLTPHGSFSLLSLTLLTGRMHQIRLHLAGKNCPIIGDDKHGNFKENKRLKKELGIKHLMLCSKSITIDKIHVEAPYPEYFVSFFNQFGEING